MKKLLLSVLCALSLPMTAEAQQMPVQPSPEQIKQMQMAMQRQMQMMAVMFDVRTSRLGFDETVQAIRTHASKRGWQVGEPQNIQAQMPDSAGARETKRMKVIPACPAQANEKLAKASGGKAPPLPCRVTVYEGKDAKVYIVRMNTSNMAKLVQDAAVTKIMAEIGAEEEAVYKDIAQ